MIKVVIIEDEIPAQRLLKETLREITIKTEVVEDKTKQAFS